MDKKLFALTITLLFSFCNAYSQVWEWTKNAGKADNPMAGSPQVQQLGVTTDAFDNVYSLGSFVDSLQLEDTLIVSSISLPLSKNLFITKYNEAGQRLWIKVFEGCTGNVGKSANSSIKINAAGELIFSGISSHQIFEGINLPTPYFLCKIKQDGSVSWIRSFESEVNFNLDMQGNIYAYLRIEASNPGTFGNQPLNPIHSYVLGKLDGDANAIWVNQYPTDSLTVILMGAVEINPAQTELLFSFRLTGRINIDGINYTDSAMSGAITRLNVSTGVTQKLLPLQTHGIISHALWADNSTIVFSFRNNGGIPANHYFNDLLIPTNNGPSNILLYMIVAAIDTSGSNLLWYNQISNSTYHPGGYNVGGQVNHLAVRNNHVYVIGNAASETRVGANVIIPADINIQGFMLRLNLSDGDLNNYTSGGDTFGITNFKYAAFGQNEKIFIGGEVRRSSYGSDPLLFGNDTLMMQGRHQVFTSKLSGKSNLISGNIYADMDNNNIFSGADYPVPNILIQNSSADILFSSHADGAYQVTTDTGDYNISPFLNVPAYYTLSPSSIPGNFATHGNELNDQDFRLIPQGQVYDVQIDITSVGRNRPGSQADFVITYRNIGTTIASGTYSFKYDAGMSFISSDSVSVTHTGDSIVFNYTNLRPFESRKNRLTFDLATTLTFEDTLLIKAEILPLLNDSNINNNFYELPLIIRAAFDPNQKTALPVESLNLLEAQSGSREIEYTLQFQNTGNDTAFHVIVTDSLEAGLDISTFRTISSSHPFQLDMKGNRTMIFAFRNIMLVDSFTNEPNSHGYVKFRIKPVTTVSVADTIYNDCNIYFDYNAPIVTNKVRTYFSTDTPPPLYEVTLLNFTAVKRNEAIDLVWTTENENNLTRFEVERSLDSINFEGIGERPSAGTGSGNYTFTDVSPLNGWNYYRLKQVYSNGTFEYSRIVKIEITSTHGFSFYPNPAENFILVNLGVFGNSTNISALIYDTRGRIVMNNKIPAGSTSTPYRINIQKLPRGVYYLKVIDGKLEYERRFIK